MRGFKVDFKKGVTTLEKWPNDVVALADSLKIEKFAVFGHFWIFEHKHMSEMLEVLVHPSGSPRSKYKRRTISWRT